MVYNGFWAIEFRYDLSILINNFFREDYYFTKRGFFGH